MYQHSALNRNKRNNETAESISFVRTESISLLRTETMACKREDTYDGEKVAALKKNDSSIQPNHKSRNMKNFKTTVLIITLAMLADLSHAQTQQVNVVITPPNTVTA